jgi:predicted enzyme related to lactoylglutathione lyase
MNMRCLRARHLLPQGLLALFMYGGCAAAVLAAPFEQPPGVEPASAEHHVGKVIWVDLVTPDLASSKRFYSGLFGWTFQDVRAGDRDYAIAFLNGRPIGGLVHRVVPPGEHRQQAWLSFIAVRDVEATKRTALEHGAKVLAEPKSYPRRGRQAVFADPEGAVFAVLASDGGDPPDFLAAPGEWIWSSLHASDAGADAAFYQALFGYDVFETTSDDGLEHVILSSDGYARASVNAHHIGSLHRHPHWLNYVRVVDTIEAAANAVALGGRVLVEPHADRHGGKLAVIADPNGAPFGLMEWTEADTKEEPK